MQRVIILIFCLLLTSSVGFSQTRKIPVKLVPQKETSTPIIAELSATEWGEITKFLEAEDWDKTVLLVSSALKKLKSENDKKQLARLQYFYLYSLAGKVAQGKITTTELQNITQAFIGKDFIMLDRNVLSDCNKSLNYVCPVKDNKNALRVTTNKAFTAIHSFEYVELLQEFNFTENNLKNVFVGGTLKKVEINPKKDKVWIMRLYFAVGWVQIVDKK